MQLSTYSGAPVDFAAYAIDPAEVIVAGNHPARAVDTSKRQPVVRWRFLPPPGYRFETSNVEVPLGASEGFYVIEARRGDAVQQVWINRSRLGLVAKESPDGLVLWGVDLQTGRAAQNLRVDFLFAGSLTTRTTSRDGTIVWRESRRPVFALASYGASRAFLSLLPQPRVPAAVVGVSAESSVARAGTRLRVVGFVRRRVAGVLRRASGDVGVSLIARGSTVAAATARLDDAGAFFVDVPIPPRAAAGKYAIIAAAPGASGGTAVHVDAASDLSLTAAASCPCNDDRAVPAWVSAARGGVPVPRVPVTVRVIRTPHLVPPGESEATPRWGTTTVLQTRTTTRQDGRIAIEIPPPTDGLASTYGIEAATDGDGATATTQVAVPTSSVSLSIEPDSRSAAPGQPVGFAVRGFDSNDDSPARGLRVTVRLSHGATAWQQTVQLDAAGRAHAVFHEASLGSNLAVVEATGPDGRLSRDAASVEVAPHGLSDLGGFAESGVSLALDRARYRPGDRVGISLSAPGAHGEALISIEGARTYAERVVPVEDGRASASFTLADAEGDPHAAAAVVEDGTVAFATAPLEIDAPGHPRSLALLLDKNAYAPGDVARVALRAGNEPPRGTIVARLSDARPGAGADFDELPALLAVGGTTSQTAAAENSPWHVWVAPARSKAGDIYAADRPRATAPDLPSIGAAAPRTLVWRVQRWSPAPIEIPLPRARGAYVLSVLCVFDDGDVGAARQSVPIR